MARPLMPAGKGLGTLIRAKREHMMWTTQHAARKIGVSRGHLSQLETGRDTNPKATVLRALQLTYGIPNEELWEAVTITLKEGGHVE